MIANIRNHPVAPRTISNLEIDDDDIIAIKEHPYEVCSCYRYDGYIAVGLAELFPNKKNEDSFSWIYLSTRTEFFLDFYYHYREYCGNEVPPLTSFALATKKQPTGRGYHVVS